MIWLQPKDGTCVFVAAEPNLGSRHCIWDFQYLVCSCVICQPCKEQPVPAEQANVVNWWSWRQKSPPNRAGEQGGRRRHAHLHSASATSASIWSGGGGIGGDRALPCGGHIWHQCWPAAALSAGLFAWLLYLLPAVLSPSGMWTSLGRVLSCGGRPVHSVTVASTGLLRIYNMLAFFLLID